MRRVFSILLGCLLCLVSADVLHGEPVTPVVACADCNDNNACTLDSCDTTRGVCRHDLLNCDDGNSCTLDSCDATTGCLSAPVPDGTACDDGDACTTGDRFICSANKLACLGQQGISCEDQDACAVNRCNPATGCEHIARSCDDGNVCTIDRCDPVSGCMHVIDSRPPDGDGDAVTDACDNCPALYNPGQNPDDCLQAAHELTVSRSSDSGKGSGTINWTTTHEFNISGFNVQGQENDGTYARLNPTPIPCLQCMTGQGATYAFTVPKLKSGRNVFIQMLGGTGDLIGIFGPASGP
jgi:hypothetical protein